MLTNTTLRLTFTNSVDEYSKLFYIFMSLQTYLSEYHNHIRYEMYVNRMEQSSAHSSAHPLVMQQ
jgi:hypothetical protein